MPPIRRVLVLAVEGSESLDILGPVEVFDYADRQVPGSYRIDVVGPTTDGQITMSNRLRLGVDPLPEPPPRHDTLLVAGGEGARRAIGDPVIVDWIVRASRRARRTTSVCTGAYLLAAAGLLDGRRATTHWEWCAGLAERHPAVEVDPDPVWVRDGDVWTSAGVTAGIDLALALVEDDLGAEVALAVARELVVFLKRPGGQSQFSGALAAQRRPGRRCASCRRGSPATSIRISRSLRWPPRPASASARSRARSGPRSARPRRPTSRRSASSAPAHCWRTAPNRWRSSPGPRGSRAPRSCAGRFTGGWA